MDKEGNVKKELVVKEDKRLCEVCFDVLLGAGSFFLFFQFSETSLSKTRAAKTWHFERLKRNRTLINNEVRSIEALMKRRGPHNSDMPACLHLRPLGSKTDIQNRG